MGADMAAAVIIMPKGIHLETECTHLIEKSKSLTTKDLVEIYDSIYCGIDEEEEKEIQEKTAEKRIEIKNMIQRGFEAMNSRQCTCIIQGYDELYISGGLSHDGVPSTAYTDMTNLWYILEVVNREQKPIPDQEAEPKEETPWWWIDLNSLQMQAENPASAIAKGTEQLRPWNDNKIMALKFLLQKQKEAIKAGIRPEKWIAGFDDNHDDFIQQLDKVLGYESPGIDGVNPA